MSSSLHSATEAQPTTPGVRKRQNERYWLPHEEIISVLGSIRAQVRAGLSFHAACAACTGQIVEKFEVHGLENIPQKGGVILAVNHPLPIDAILSHILANARHDLEIVVKDHSQHPALGGYFRELMCGVKCHLINDQPGERVQEAQKIIESLCKGRAISIVPWGTMDTQGANPRLNIAAEQMAHLARISGAPVVPVKISVESSEPLHLPLDKISGTVGIPIAPTESEAIQKAVKALHGRG